MAQEGLYFVARAQEDEKSRIVLVKEKSAQS
jgi:hypothetical protein